MSMGVNVICVQEAGIIVSGRNKDKQIISLVWRWWSNDDMTDKLVSSLLWLLLFYGASGESGLMHYGRPVFMTNGREL